MLHSVARGNGAPDVILLHGVFMDHRLWDRVALGLDRPTLAVDMPGHGSSPPAPPGSSLTDHVDAVAALLLQRTSSPVTVVGHSWGGMVALRLARLRPELVRSIVLVNTPLRRVRGAERVGFQLQRALLAAGLPAPVYGRIAARSLIGVEHRRQYPQSIDRLAEVTDRLGRRGLLDVLRSVLLEPDDALEMLLSLNTPWAAVAGDRDYVLSGGVREALDATSRLTVVPGGHTSPLEAPQAVTAAIETAAAAAVRP